MYNFESRVSKVKLREVNEQVYCQKKSISGLRRLRDMLQDDIMENTNNRQEAEQRIEEEIPQ